MACLDMFNPPMSPRISFSNDFIDPNHIAKHDRSTPPSATSPDFEFSVSGYSMIAADEIFSKGRILPLKDNCTAQMQRMTLRDELRMEDESPRPPKGPARWKDLLGLRKTQSVGRKHEKGEGSVDRVGGRRSTLAPAQEVQIDGVTE